MFKKMILLLVSVALLTVGCAGFELFPDAEPLCPPVEQETSMIYRYADPATADFVLLIGTATYLEKNPEGALKLLNIVDKIDSVVKGGTQYDVLSKLVAELLGPLQYIVVSPLIKRFATLNIPMTQCDKELIIGHLQNQRDLIKTIIK